MRLLNAGDRGSTRFLLSLIVVLFLYSLLRFWGFADQCLWFDEIFSVHAASQPFNNFFNFIALDLIHPPVFYLLLKIWISIGGDGLVWLRFLPVLLTILAVFPFFMLCRELRLRPTAVIISLTLFAVNGSLIKYSQEVRMYALVLLISLFSLWLFARFFNLGKNIWTLTFVNILLIYTHYFGGFLVLGEVVAILCFQRIKLRQSIVSAAVSFATLSPWLLYVYNTSTDTSAELSQNIGWVTQPGFWETLTLVLGFIEPFYFRLSSSDPLTIIPITVALIILIKFTGILAIITADKENYSSQSVRILPVICGVPIVVAFILSWILPESIWGVRHLIYVFPLICILLGWLVSLIGSRPLRYAVTAIGATIIVAAFILDLPKRQDTPVWCEWEKAANTIADKERDSQIVVFEELAAYHAWYASKNRPNIKIIVLKDVNGINEDKAYFLPRGFDGVEKTDQLTNTKDVWFLFRKTNIDSVNKLVEEKSLKSTPGFIDQNVMAFVIEQR